MPNDIDGLSEKISSLFSNRARRFKSASFFVKFMFLAVASAVVSAVQFLQVPEGQQLTSVQIIGICGSLIVFAGAVFTLFTEDDASEELDTARQAIEMARDVHDRPPVSGPH